MGVTERKGMYAAIGFGATFVALGVLEFVAIFYHAPWIRYV